MNDDDLTSQLEAWAAATDPAADPIAVTDLDDVVVVVDGAATTNARPRRGLAVAAAILVVLGLAGAVAVTRSTDEPVDDVVLAPDPVPTPSTPEDGIPVQVVLVNQAGADVVLEWLPYECPPRAACIGEFVPAQEPGTTSVVFDDHQTDPLRATFTARRCEAASCQVVTVAPAEAIGSCTTPSLALDGPTRAVVTVTREGEGIACTLEEVDAFPALTVPPAFSLRSRSFAVDCGPGAYDAGELAGPADRPAAEEAFDCFADAVGGDELVELVTSEIEPDDLVLRSWWRALPAPVDGYTVEVFRAPRDAEPWVRVRCGGIGPPGYGSIYPLLTGCTEEEDLPLDAPPLDDPATPPPTTTTSGDGSETTTVEEAPPLSPAVDVVLDGRDLPRGEDPIRWTWAITIGGGEVASGSVHGDDADGYLEWPVAVITRDLAVGPTDTEISIAIDEGSVRERTSTCTAGTTGPEPAAEGVLVIRPAPGSCTTEWTDELPALTVPPSWSLRMPATACVDLAPDARWSQCLIDAELDGTEVAEWSSFAFDVMSTYRVERGVITVVQRTIASDAVTWTTMTCEGIEIGEVDGGDGITFTDCGSGEVPMSLIP